MRAVRILLQWLLISVLMPAPAWCMDIVEVLQRSQTSRLQALPPAPPDGERAAVVRASFRRVVALTAPPREVELRVVSGGLFAEAMLGHVIVASEALADLPEGERLLVLAHELGHIALGHWDELCNLYRQHIPGEVRPETTDPVAQALGAEAHAQTYRQEFAADTYGYRVVYRLGFRMDTVYGLMLRSTATQDSATHPGTRRRVMHLREVDARLEHSSLQAAGSPLEGEGEE